MSMFTILQIPCTLPLYLFKLAMRSSLFPRCLFNRFFLEVWSRLEGMLRRDHRRGYRF